MVSRDPISAPVTKNKPDRSNRDARINVRVTANQAALIRQAAELQDKSITDFVVSSAAASAEQILADRRWFLLDEEAWDTFAALLERPAVYKPRLNALMNSEDRFVD